MKRVILILMVVLAQAGASAVSAAPLIERFSVRFEVGRKSGIACNITGGSLSLRAGRFLGSPTLQAKGDLGGSSIVCTLPDGRKLATQGHVALFTNGAKHADIVLFAPRKGSEWLVQGAVQFPRGPREVFGHLTFQDVK